MKARYPALIATFLFLLQCMPSAQAAAYYVSPTGNALWSQCTNISTPCSATTGMDNAVAGDIVYFRGGTYDVGQSVYPLAVLYPKHSGTPGNPITFMAYSGETPVINGHVQIKVTGIAGAGTNNSMLVDDTKNFTSLGIVAGDNVRIIGKDGGAWVRSVADSHTIILAPSGDSMNGFYNAANCASCPNFVTRDAYDIGSDSTVVLGNVNHNYTVFDGFTIQANDGTEKATLKISGTSETRTIGNVVRNCIIIGGSRKIVHGDNRDGLRIDDSNDTLVQNCKIYGIQNVRSNGANTAAIKLYHVFNVTIENCEIFNSTVGIFDKSVSLNNTFRYNYIHHCNLGFYFSGYAWDGPPPFRSDHRNAKIYNNVVAYTTGGAFSDVTQEWSDSDNMEVFNNIFYSGYVKSVGTGVGAGAKKLYNNIWFGVPTDYDVCHIGIYTNGSTNPRGTREGLKESDYNDFYNVSGRLCIKTIKLNDTTGSTIYLRYYSLPAWQSSHELQDGSNPDLHSISSDPKFLNPSGTMSQLDDFRLAADSPCRGTGKNGMDMGANIDLVGVNPTPLKTCSELGGACCSSGQICQGSRLSSSDCSCCSGTCRTPVCGDGPCEGSENCQTCPADCLPGGQVCCSGTAYAGTCCSDSDCSSPLVCTSHSCSQPPTGLEAYWSFDEGSGTIALDSSGNGNTGTLVNGPVWTAGKSGWAVRLNGSNYMTASNSASLNPTAITVAVWINASTWSGNNRIVQKAVDGAQYRLLRESSLLKWDVGGTQQTSAVPSSGVWHHVAATCGSSGKYTYVDGVPVASNATSCTVANASGSYALYIGAKDSSGTIGDMFYGSIDEVRIYSRALSAQEILSLYQSGGSCLHKSDNNPCDSCVSISELNAFIDRWKVNNVDVTLKELIEAIGLWKRGCS